MAKPTERKYDFKKEYKDLYLPKEKPMLIDVPEMNFIMVNGTGDPTGESYQGAMQVLYSLTFTIKMSKMSGKQPEGYFDYVLPPLEGLWWSPEGSLNLEERSEWQWISMIRQPDFVTPEVFEWAVRECREKKSGIDVSRARLERFTEGLCVQTMHIGPYAQEQSSMARMEEFITREGLISESGLVRKHHEIYLGDPRKTAPERLRTVLRTPVRRGE